jgi:CheY-like chemotaxis protein
MALATDWIPDEIVLDIGLPGMCGNEMAQEPLPQTRDCALIALSGFGSDADIFRSTEAGFQTTSDQAGGSRSARRGIARRRRFPITCGSVPGGDCHERYDR